MFLLTIRGFWFDDMDVVKVDLRWFSTNETTCLCFSSYTCVSVCKIVLLFFFLVSRSVFFHMSFRKWLDCLRFVRNIDVNTTGTIFCNPVTILTLKLLIAKKKLDTGLRCLMVIAMWKTLQQFVLRITDTCIVHIWFIRRTRNRCI